MNTPKTIVRLFITLLCPLSSETLTLIGSGHDPIRHLKARAILIDMEEGVLNHILKGSLGELFDAKQLISDVSGSGNNWATGFKWYGPKYRDKILENVRREVENCDSIQSFLLFHSLGGGTGSGVGTYMLELLQDNFPNIYRFVVPVFPSEDDDVVTSPYNSILSLSQLAQHADCVLPLCNQALVEICSKTPTPGSGRNATSQTESSSLSTSKPWDQMNKLAAQLLLDLTSSMRFAGTLNVDLNEITMNLVPYPRMQFLLSSLSACTMERCSRSPVRNLSQMFSDAFSREQQLITADPKQHLYLACCLMLRGDIDMHAIRRNIDRIQRTLKFPHWNREGWKIGHCSVPGLNQRKSLLCLSNNSCICNTFQDLHSRFLRLYKRKAHVHHYTEYVDISFFDEALETVTELIENYNALVSYYDCGPQQVTRLQML
ncbi:tubulin epsilon chain [Pelomyxa schiedti]|nr:tubulin epsilon chain [Pelomyxa schiedti]